MYQLTKLKNPLPEVAFFIFAPISRLLVAVHEHETHKWSISGSYFSSSISHCAFASTARATSLYCELYKLSSSLTIGSITSNVISAIAVLTNWRTDRTNSRALSDVLSSLTVKSGKCNEVAVNRQLTIGACLTGPFKETMRILSAVHFRILALRFESQLSLSAQLIS